MSIGHFQQQYHGKVTILWKLQLNSQIPLEDATQNPLTIPLTIRADFRGVDLRRAVRGRGWWNTAEIVLFEISKSMKPYPPVTVRPLCFTHTTYIYIYICMYIHMYIYIYIYIYINKLRPVIGLFEPTNLDEVPSRIPPTSQSPS